MAGHEVVSSGLAAAELLWVPVLGPEGLWGSKM